MVNEDLNWTNPSNFLKFKELIGTATIPSPMVWGKTGDKVYITLINLGMPTAGNMDAHTVHMHGAHVATQLDGFPETSFGVPMWMDFDKTPPVATYIFDTEHPGTYMYHCHVEASEHVQMGMYGGQDCIDSLCKQMRKINKIDTSAIADIPTEPVNIDNIETVNYVEICREPSCVNDNFFPQFYPMHNHDDYKVTNNGVYPGGQLTYIQTDAPDNDQNHTNE